MKCKIEIELDVDDKHFKDFTDYSMILNTLVSIGVVGLANAGIDFELSNKTLEAENGFVAKTIKVPIPENKEVNPKDVKIFKIRERMSQ